MASGKKSGNISVIGSSDEDSDQEKTDLKTKTTKQSNKSDQQQDKNPSPTTLQKQITENVFKGLAARQLLMFFQTDLDDDKLEVHFTPFKGKEKVILSSPNQTLLATKKQQLEKLLKGLKYKDVDSMDRTFAETQEMVKKHSLKIVLCGDSDNKLRVYYKDLSEFQKFEDRLKVGINPGGNTTEEKRRIDRRSRSFGDTSTEASSSPSSDQDDTEKYESKLPWHSKSEPPKVSLASDVKKTVASSTYLGENIKIKDSFTVEGIHMKVYQGSIIKAEVDAIINAANDRLNNCGGVAEVISKAAGYEMERECRERMGSRHKIMVSENIVTKAGKLPCKWIIHAVGPRWDDYKNKENALVALYNTVFNILQTACGQGIKSVVMPPISSGIFGVPKQACAAMYIKALLDFSEKSLSSERRLEEFYFVDNKDDILGFICSEYHDGLSKGREYLEPKKVLERLGIATWNANSSWERCGSNLTNTACKNNSNFRSSGGASGAGNSQRASSNHAPSYQITSICVKRLKKDAEGCDEFLVGDSLKVYIYRGNIIDLMNVSVLVCAEGRDQHGQGFLAKQINDKATKNQRREISKLFSGAKHLQFSQVLPLSTGLCHYKLVFYAIIKKFPNEQPRPENLDMLWKTTSNILGNANKKKKNSKPISIAIPMLGTGSIQNSEYLQQYAEVVSNCILDFSKQIQKNSRLQEIHLVNHQAPATEALKKAFAAMQENKQDRPRRRWVPDKVSGNDFKRTQFDPSKYKLEETWNVLKQTEVQLEDFIETSHKIPKNKQITKKHVDTKKTTENSSAQGNIRLIDSSDEETDPFDENDKQSEEYHAAATKDDDSDYDNIEASEEEKITCVVCMDDEMQDPVVLKKCRHIFCRECIEEYFSSKPVCPVCNTVYGEVFGNQPDGTAKVYKDKTSLPGFDCPTLIIHYEIPDGVQSEEHSNPGVGFTGVSRQGYLPDNKQGRIILGMLKRAFEHCLIFTVGFSRTSGKDNMVTWNDIHHKTRREGGPEKYGYPDPEYLERVKEELEAKGITEN